MISDARLNGHDASVVVERLLSLSGEDSLTVHRKHRIAWEGKLPARLMLCTNELPRLGDASGAIAGRFVTLTLERSWLHNENNALEPQLANELPGILNWALDGLDRLQKQQRFTRPESTDATFIALQDLASPVRAFIRDRCQVAPDLETTVDDLWQAWRKWAEDNGHGKGGTRQVFGRDLRAALPTLRDGRSGPRGEQQRIYRGLGLEPEA